MMEPRPYRAGRSRAASAALLVLPGSVTSRSILQRSRPRLWRRAGLNTEKTMFAVIKTGGKQYRVAAEDKITVMTLPGEPGDVVSFDVLALFDGETSHLSAPLV